MQTIMIGLDNNQIIQASATCAHYWEQIMVGQNLAKEERKAYNLTITYSNVLKVPPLAVITALKETHNFPWIIIMCYFIHVAFSRIISKIYSFGQHSKYMPCFINTEGR